MNAMRPFVLLVWLFVLTALPWQGVTPADEPGWGHFKGQFLFGGEPPARAAFKLAGPDAKWLEDNGHMPVLDESLVVDPGNRGIANVCLWLYQRRDAKVPIHPELRLRDPKAGPMADDRRRGPQTTIDLAGGRYQPHIATIQVDEKFVLRNRDGFTYALSLAHRGDPKAPVLAKDKSVELQFSETSRLPARMQCALHPWVNGWAIVQPHPYMAVTDEEGKFKIRNLPAGEWTIQTWHEQAGYLQKVKRGDKHMVWGRGRFTVTIKPGETVDLGEITVDAAAF